jgi:hypothetical protein
MTLVTGKPAGRADLMRDLRTASDDPLSVLAVVARYRRLLDEVAARAATLARRTGKSWDEVAHALGTTRQAAWQRYRQVEPEERPSCFALHRFPNRRRRHLAVRDAIVEDYGIRISERAALNLTSRLSGQPSRPHEIIVLEGRHPSTGERMSTRVSTHALSLYLMPYPATLPKDLRMIPRMDRSAEL